MPERQLCPECTYYHITHTIAEWFSLARNYRKIGSERDNLPHPYSTQEIREYIDILPRR